MSRLHDRLIKDKKKWSRVRRAVLERDKFRCRSCGRSSRLEADHVVPLERGGDPWAMDNLQALCRACHIAKTRSERPGFDPELERVREEWRALLDMTNGSLV